MTKMESEALTLGSEQNRERRPLPHTAKRKKSGSKTAPALGKSITFFQDQSNLNTTSLSFRTSFALKRLPFLDTKSVSNAV